MWSSCSESFTLQNRSVSAYGAASSWSGQRSPAGAEPISGKFVESEEAVDEETAKSVTPEEVNSLVHSARSS